MRKLSDAYTFLLNFTLLDLPACVKNSSEI